MKNLTLGLLFLLSSSLLFGQIDYLSFAEEKLEERGEFYFTFPVASNSIMYNLTRELSIDGFKEGLVYAYANASEFENFLTYNIGFTPVFDYYNSAKALTMATTVAQMSNWDRYPTHEVYLEMMQAFATDYPDLCQYEVYGYSENGVPIVGVVISDNVGTDEDEPEIWWSSTMHGDELVCYVLTLRMIDYLLSNYGTNPQVTNLINNIEIYINPLANPDGTFNGSPSLVSVSEASRSNTNNIDLNRNFPTLNGDAYTLQTESQAMMDYADVHDFVMSVNTHSGIELINYPWDTWQSDENLNADNNWWEYVCFVYADQVEADAPTNYFEGPGNMNNGPYNTSGVTHGADWYYAIGTRQDYMNYYQNIKELTLEWSDNKDLDVNSLPTYWEYNKDAMLLYTEQVLYGLRGIVSDACTGSALSNVKVEIIGHDKDNSEVYSSAPIGNYHRPIYEGTYDFTFSLDGYQSQTHTVTITNDVSTRLDIQLVPNSVAAPDFSASGVNVPIGTDVSFTDLSSGTVSVYSWVFEGGDPAISSDANPIINYANDGVYNVSLEIESAGCTITELKEDYITVYIPGAPVADFVADVTETCMGIVQFTNSSVDAVSYEWDFGDGSSLSSEANPTHIYDQSGVFTVSLTATNTYGSNTKTYTDYITVNLPAAPITVGAQSCGPATLSLSASGESTLQWYDANIDGNLINTGNNMEDYFTNTTTYYVQSGISPSYFLGGNSDIDVNGGNHTSNAYYLIFNAHEDFRLVSVDVNASSAGNRIIQLRNSSDVVIESKTVNLSTGINTVELNFDISAGTNYQLKCGTSTPNLWRNNSGTSWPYNISDVVSITGTNAGNTDYYYYFYNWEIFYGDECISSRTPVTAEIIETPNADAPENVTTCDSYYLPALTNGEYYLSSNGVDPIAVGTEITSSQTIYVYAESGTTPNCTNENSFNITINETPLVDNPVDITVCDSYVLPTLTNGEYFLSPNGVDPIAEGTEITSSQTIYVYAETGTTPNCFAETSFTVTINNATQVDIGDNIIGDCDATVMLDAGADYSSYEWNGTLGSQTLEVTTTGTYTIIVEDANGCTSTDDVNVEIRENPVAEVITTLESSPGANDATASVNVISGEPPFNYMWFNSNQTHEVSGLTNGIYCVTVTSSNACSVEACGTVNTNGAPPMANFVANQTFGCDNLTVQFTDESSNNPTSWFWEFGDGSSTSSEANPIHTYSVPGIYNVSLAVTNAEGSNSVTYESYITIGETPTLELSMTEETVLGNDGTASVIITGGAEPYEILWTGGLDTETIVGLNAGEYCVTVTGDNTCQAYDCIIVSLEDVIPSVVDFVASQTEACGSLTVQFTDLSYYEATSWGWDFGDGGTSNDQNPEHFYASPGSYTVSLSIESEFGQDELEVPSYITVFEKPVIEFDITHESGAGNADGQIEMIITGGEAPYTINWSNNEHSLLISGLSAGLYSVAIIDDNGCLGSGIAEVNVITSISDEAKNKLQIYPNPTDGEFTIISDKIINKVTIVDALGRVCVSQKSNTNKIIIDSNLRQGVYQVKVITENGEFVKKLVVR